MNEGSAAADTDQGLALWIGVLLGKLVREHIHFSLRLFPRHTRFQSAGQGERARAAVSQPESAIPGADNLIAHHQRNPALRRIWNGADKTTLRDTDDREREPCEFDCSPDDLRIRVEPLLPTDVAQDHYRVRAGRAALFGRKATSKRHLCAQH